MISTKISSYEQTSKNSLPSHSAIADMAAQEFRTTPEKRLCLNEQLMHQCNSMNDNSNVSSSNNHIKDKLMLASNYNDNALPPTLTTVAEAAGMSITKGVSSELSEMLRDTTVLKTSVVNSAIAPPPIYIITQCQPNVNSNCNSNVSV
uniref:LexA repressor n=1 Tax=Lygus hesperus TaxID=30085 RepID=A0A0A9XIS6_LYGHE